MPACRAAGPDPSRRVSLESMFIGHSVSAHEEAGNAVASLHHLTQESTQGRVGQEPLTRQRPGADRVLLLLPCAKLGRPRPPQGARRKPNGLPEVNTQPIRPTQGSLCTSSQHCPHQSLFQHLDWKGPQFSEDNSSWHLSYFESQDGLWVTCFPGSWCHYLRLHRVRLPLEVTLRGTCGFFKCELMSE